MDTPGRRILKWREHIGKTPREFEALTGIPYSTLKTLETDPKKGKPSFDVLSKLRKAFPTLNIDWLFDEGDSEPMLKGDRNFVKADKMVQLPDEPAEMNAEANPDSYYHRYHALLDMVKTGFFGSPEQLLEKGKKALASSGAASLYELVDTIQAETFQRLYVTGFQQAGVVRQLA
jgi:transcriptional regulator with XRE-family HTH domain